MPKLMDEGFKRNNFILQDSFGFQWKKQFPEFRFLVDRVNSIRYL